MSRRSTRVTRLGDGHYTFDLPLSEPADRIVTELAQAGATLVSMNPLRDTLEDIFVTQVTSPGVADHDRGLGTPPAREHA